MVKNHCSTSIDRQVMAKIQPLQGLAKANAVSFTEHIQVLEIIWE